MEYAALIGVAIGCLVALFVLRQILLGLRARHELKMVLRRGEPMISTREIHKLWDIAKPDPIYIASTPNTLPNAFYNASLGVAHQPAPQPVMPTNHVLVRATDAHGLRDVIHAFIARYGMQPDTLFLPVPLYCAAVNRVLRVDDVIYGMRVVPASFSCVASRQPPGAAALRAGKRVSIQVPKPVEHVEITLVMEDPPEPLPRRRIDRHLGSKAKGRV